MIIRLTVVLGLKYLIAEVVARHSPGYPRKVLDTVSGGSENV